MYMDIRASIYKDSFEQKHSAVIRELNTRHEYIHEHHKLLLTVLPHIEKHAVISEFYQNPLQLQLVPITACRYRVRCRYKARYDSHSNTRPIF